MPNKQPQKRKSDVAKRPGQDALGQRIRQLRLARGMIAADLASGAGVSPSFLSQVERGLASPSLKVLNALANALEVTVGALVEEDPRDQYGVNDRIAEIVRADARKVMRRASGPDYQLLSPDLRGEIEFILVELAVGDAALPASHEGEEQLVVLRGALTLEVAGQRFVLQPGDAVRFEPSQPHRTLNEGAETVVYLSASTPPSF
jgi:transcriptional regulator with XRE-family HTH domain